MLIANPLESLESLERLKSLQSLESLQSLQNIEMYKSDYRDVKIRPDSVVYCDIPYKGTDKYFNDFNVDTLLLQEQTICRFIKIS